MLHLFLISQLTVFVLANPFHKYPYVFLLDVGNEEIEKFNTEQIRLSIPGGSLAIRYPAVGEGDTIGHVRVSGIDFGTDLKASIIQGGPGYKYAVFVFMGNAGVPYDAVITIQTIPNTDIPAPKIMSNMNTHNVNSGLEDTNDSAEDTSDNTETKTMYRGNTKSQIMQSSSNVYEYTNNDDFEGDVFKNRIQYQYDDDFQNAKEDADKEKADDYNDDEKSHSDSSDEDVRVISVNKNQYGLYEAFKPHWFGGVRFYPQAALYTQEEYAKSTYDADDEGEKDEPSKSIDVNYYKDTNNNIKGDYGSPIEY